MLIQQYIGHGRLRGLLPFFHFFLLVNLFVACINSLYKNTNRKNKNYPMLSLTPSFLLISSSPCLARRFLTGKFHFSLTYPIPSPKFCAYPSRLSLFSSYLTVQIMPFPTETCLNCLSLTGMSSTSLSLVLAAPMVETPIIASAPA